MKKLFSKALLGIYIAFLVLLFGTCGIETFEPIVELQPPMGVTAKLLTNRIEVSFWGLNNEYYFSGYNIYVTTDPADAKDGEGNLYTNDDGIEGYPTIYKGIKPVDTATRYKVILSRNYDYSDFINELDYFFYVEAYSIDKNISSPRSDYTNVYYTNI